MVEQFTVATRGQGLHEITSQVGHVVKKSGCDEGVCTVFVRHTSASLVIQENADPTAKEDLERWLGTWQGIYLWEHRRRGGERELVVHVGA